MDKGFNDDELADIMNEIEVLEQEFTEEVTAQADQPAAEEVVEEQVEEPVAEVQAEKTEEPVQEVQAETTESVEAQSVEEEKVLHEVTNMPEEQVTPTAVAHDDNVHQLHPTSSSSSAGSAETSMSFKVEGDMTLDLTFNISGREVQLNVNENGLEIGLGDGAKFTLPLDKTAKQIKAA